MMPTSANSPMGPPDQHYSPDNPAKGDNMFGKKLSSLFVISALTTSNIRNWIRVADMDQLEMVVLEGQVIFIKIDNKYLITKQFQGHRLLSENASDNKVRQFLKTVPAYIVSMITTVLVWSPHTCHGHHSPIMVTTVLVGSPHSCPGHFSPSMDHTTVLSWSQQS